MESAVVAATSQTARCECKYAIRSDLLEPMRAFIQPYCQLDEHAAASKDGFYSISTLYLDNDGYRLYWDVEDGIPVRLKLRARTYGDSDIVKLEIKRRIDGSVIKSTVSIPREGWERRLPPYRDTSGLRFTPAGKEAFDAFLTTMQILSARPKMLVRYERQAFRSMLDQGVRITFDRHMVHQPMKDYDLTGWPDRWEAIDDQESMDSPTSDALFELKFRKSVPAWCLDLVRRFGLVRRGFSKYASGVRRAMAEEDACAHWTPLLSTDQSDRGTKWTF